MPRFLRVYCMFCWLFTGVFLVTDCQSGTQEQQQTEVRQRHHKKHHRQASFRANSAQAGTQTTVLPKKVYTVLAYVRANNRAMDGYVGGRWFGNFENHLPRSDTDGKPIQYQEWDVNPKVQGQNRGVERLVTGSDGRAWYTNDHYNTFVEVN